MTRTLVVTNDYPPRQGGIQAFVHELAVRQPRGSVVVYASGHHAAARFDAAQPFPVVRHPTGLLMPTPATRRRVLDAFTEFGCTSVWFGAAAPLGVLAPSLRAVGATRIVATTHGHEAGWAMVPAGRQALRFVGAHCDTVTYLGDYFRERLARVVPDASVLHQLTPGVDVETFRPGLDGTRIRARHGLVGRPVVVCVSRLVRRKGQDLLLRALPLIRREIPDAAVLFVGDGPYRADLTRLAGELGMTDDVAFTGGIAHHELPEHYAAGDVFAMPCRTRRYGMDVEGLGIVYLEAAACGLPVIGGDSGGAPDAVQDGRTGFVVDGRNVGALADRCVRLLSDERLRKEMGTAGRAWVESSWRWDLLAARLGELLTG